MGRGQGHRIRLTPESRMSTRISPLAGQPPTAPMLIDVAKLVAAYYSDQPDPTLATQRVAFGTSGHRG